MSNDDVSVETNDMVTSCCKRKYVSMTQYSYTGSVKHVNNSYHM